MHAPSINHLFFADDSVLFFKDNLESGGIPKSVLDRSAMCSGLRTNNAKSQVCFSPNTPHKFKKLMCKTLDCNIASNNGIYLGNCLDGEVHRKEAFSNLLNALTSKLQGWMGHFLSKVG